MSQPIECCGKELHTAFCPDCGKEGSRPIIALLRHVRSATRLKESHVKWTKTCMAERQKKDPEYDIPDDWQRRLEREKQLAEKWISWEKALEDLISQTRK